MQSLIERCGAQAVVAPSMREIPLDVHQEALDFAEKLRQKKVDLLILMTGVGTRFLVQLLEKVMPKEEFVQLLRNVPTLTRGPKSVQALKELGLVPTVQAAAPNTWQDVLQALDHWGNAQSKKIFVQEYGAQNKEFLSELKKRGAHVFRVPIYRWALPEDTAPMRHLIRSICDGKVDIVLWTNATQLHHVLRVAAEEGLERSLQEALQRLVNASIGPVMSETLRDAQLQADYEASTSKIGIFVKEVMDQSATLINAKKNAQNLSTVPAQVYAILPYDNAQCAESVFMKSCRMEKTARRPIWLMRQAGRYMKEYRELRAKVSFLELCKNSDLACQVTVEAQEKLGADAAILFSDILLILEPMGVGLEYTRGDGPCIHRPVRCTEDIENLRPFDARESLSFVLDAVKKIRSALQKNVPLIGFAGAPFTVASYLIEGQGSRQYLHTKNLMYTQGQAWHKLMEYITQNTVRYLLAQIEAGAQAVQIFDSWVGCLSSEDYREYVFPHMKNLFAQLPANVPSIHFGTGNATFIETMRQAGGSVIGMDWRMPIAPTWDRLGNVAVQGNLDPAVLTSDIETIRRKVREILQQTQGRPGHIFNLGHGILPQTPFDHAKALVEMVHEYPVS